MALFDRLRGRSLEGGNDKQLGLIKLGGVTYNASWNYNRILSNVYQNPTAKRCIERIAYDFQRPAWQLKERGTNNVIEFEDAPNAYRILRQPRPGKLSGTQLQYIISRDLDLAGGNVVYKMRGPDDDVYNRAPVVGLRPLDMHRTVVVADDDGDLIGFLYMRNETDRVVLLPEDVIYVHYANPAKPAQPLAPAVAAGLSAETDAAAMRFNFQLLNNDSALPGYLVVEGLTTDRFKSWKQAWDQGDAPGKTRFMNGSNAKYVKVGQTNQELTYGDLRSASQEDICRAFGMAKVVIDPTDATFANLDNAARGHIKSLVHPRWTLVGDEYTLQLGDDLAALEGLSEGFDVGFDLDQIEELQEGLADYVARTLPLVEADIKTVNEVRKDLGLDEVAWGDVPRAAFLASINGGITADAPAPEVEPVKALQAATTKTLKTKGLPKEPAKGFDRAVSRHEKRAQRSMERFFDKQADAITARVSSKGLNRAALTNEIITKDATDWFDGERWNKELAEVWFPLLGDAADSIGGLILSTLDEVADFDMGSERMKKYLDARSVDIAGLINGTTSDDIRKILGDLAETGEDINVMKRAISGYFKDQGPMRAERSARTEIIGAANFSAIEAARQSDIVDGKIWLAASDAEQDCADLDGMKVGLDESFGDADQPPLHVNCRCTVQFSLKD